MQVHDVIDHFLNKVEHAKNDPYSDPIVPNDPIVLTDLIRV